MSSSFGLILLTQTLIPSFHPTNNLLHSITLLRQSSFYYLLKYYSLFLFISFSTSKVQIPTLIHSFYYFLVPSILTTLPHYEIDNLYQSMLWIAQRLNKVYYFLIMKFLSKNNILTFLCNWLSHIIDCSKEISIYYNFISVMNTKKI